MNVETVISSDATVTTKFVVPTSIFFKCIVSLNDMDMNTYNMWNVWSMLMVYTTAQEPTQSFVISELDNCCCKTLLQIPFSVAHCSFKNNKKTRTNGKIIIHEIRLESENERIDKDETHIDLDWIL